MHPLALLHGGPNKTEFSHFFKWHTLYILCYFDSLYFPLYNGAPFTYLCCDVVKLFKHRTLYNSFFKKREIDKEAKVKTYRVVIVSSIIYGSESWVFIKELKSKFETPI